MLNVSVKFMHAMLLVDPSILWTGPDRAVTFHAEMICVKYMLYMCVHPSILWTGPDRAVMLHAEKLGMCSLQLALMQGTFSLQFAHVLCCFVCLPSHGCENCQCCRCPVSMPQTVNA